MRKMTSQAARAFALRGVGELREGQRANVVVLDADAVADRATFADPMQFPVGIRDVLVGGEPIIRRAVLTGARPGKVVQ